MSNKLAAYELIFFTFFLDKFCSV